MVVIVLEKVPISLIGELKQRMLEIKKGCYVGKMSAVVREELWKKCIDKKISGSVIMVCDSNNEQGYEIRMDGVKKRKKIDIDGIQMILSLKS